MFEGLFRPTHLLLILAVALLVYGPKKLPQLGEALGKTMRDFKKAVSDKAEETTPESASQEAKRLQDHNG
ncbi:MAG TPA: twin-arginine translocase TatA/TatE family subunit [Anaeromyxobacteraceae bacterium]|nr:twin-arginine translocase TatA/TatE family subunit [Anaeromyxobacteraceae bacterium]